MDYLPKGEFLFGEILPKLLPPIIRRGYLITEGDPLVLTCDVDPSEGVGIHWHSKTELELTVSRILDKFKVILPYPTFNTHFFFFSFQNVCRFLIGIPRNLVKETFRDEFGLMNKCD